MSNLIIKYFKYGLLALLICSPLFLYFDLIPIRNFDESRNAMNAFEMLKNGNLFVLYFEGEPDLWNTKPPLLIWLQTLSFSIFGFNEFAFRLPSVVAALGTFIAFIYVSEKYLRTFWFGAIAAMVLVTMGGYMGYHGARFGEFDAMLTFFTLLSGLSLFAYIERKNTKYLYLFFIFLILGCLTKGVAGLLFGPAYVIYLLYKKELLKLFKNRHFYFGMGIFILVIGGYYILREQISAGYLEAVWNNELGGRFADKLQKARPFSFYFDRFKDHDMKHWFLWIPTGIVAGLVTTNARLKNLTVFSTVMALSHLLIISLSRNKLHWYAFPEVPYYTMIIATLVYSIFIFLRKFSDEHKSRLSKLIPYGFLFILFLFPYQDISRAIKRNLNNNSSIEKNYAMSYYLRDAKENNEKIDGYGVLMKGYRPETNFYIAVLNDQGIEVEKKDWKKLKAGDNVLTFQKEIKNYLAENYQISILGNSKNVVKYKIHGPKEK
jgi:4-amino-4-deoxy-L-arabinose transferase-like glycosyltransferase